MLKVLGETWPLMLGILLLQLGNGLQGTLLGVRGPLEGIDPGSMGFVMSAYFVGFLGGSKLTPLMLRRVGHIRVFAALGSLISVAFILYAAWVNPVFWAFMRLLVGFCFSGLYVVAESWINDSSTNENRGKALSLYLIVQMIGIVSGQVLLNAADPGGYLLFILISVMVSLSIAPILLSVSPAPVYQLSKPMSLKELYEASPLGVVGTIGVGGVFSALFGMSAVYASEQGFSLAEVSYFVMSIYVGGMLLQYPIGWMSDRMDRRVLIIFVCLISAGTCAVPFFLEPSLTLLLAVSFFIGGTANPLYSLLIAYTNDHLEREQMSAASGGLLFVNGCGAMGGPIVVGYVMKQLGPNGFFAYVGLLMLAIACYGVWRSAHRSSGEDIVEATPYIALSARTSAVAVDVATELAVEELEETEREEEQAEKHDTVKNA
ncbi:MAG: MFS transporter [Granulosicoccaceae bacterium]